MPLHHFLRGAVRAALTGALAALAACGPAPDCGDPAAAASLKAVFLDHFSDATLAVGGADAFGAAEGPAAIAQASGLELRVEPSLIGRRDFSSDVAICSAALKVAVDKGLIDRTLDASIDPYWAQVGRRWRASLDLYTRDDLLDQIRAVVAGARTVTPQQKAALDKLLGMDTATDPRAADTAAALTVDQREAVTETMEAMQQLLGSLDAEHTTVALQADYTARRATGAEGEERVVVEARFDDQSITGLRALLAWQRAMRQVDALGRSPP
ncbi:MAG: hypothetical protein V4505_09375 [Pseudomonadota bacterium]